MFRLICSILPVAVFAIACGVEESQMVDESPEKDEQMVVNALLPGPCVYTNAIDNHQVHFEYDIDERRVSQPSVSTCRPI